MLSTIHVRNFAIIDEVHVEFGAGMNVLTGETGAGKSILVDALGLAMGDRASADAIRAGQKRADITASFQIAEHSEAANWLVDQAFESDGECLMRRVINKDGPSRGFINGNPVPMQSLKTLGAMLVNIHGQHEHQSLQQSDAQRHMLDARGGLSKLVKNVASSYQQWHALQSELDELQTARDQRDDRIAYLRFQLEELVNLDLQENELQTLEPERLQLANAERLAENSSRAADALADDDNRNAQSLLAQANRDLAAIVEFDKRLVPIVSILDEAQVHVAEAADALRRYQADIDVDPKRQEFVEQRLADIQRLARKHHVEPSALVERTHELQAALKELENADATLEALEQNVLAAELAYKKTADKLSRARKKAAKPFAAEVEGGMQTLGMPGGQFEVECEPSAKMSKHGTDAIRFLVSANPGQPPQAIQKVASGGELSRISLAIQVAAGRRDAVGSMIFDEVDAGVGGAVAEMVGQQMRALAEQCQVLAVTHLPQVAGQAHHHHKVTKVTGKKTTTTGIETLSEDMRVEEIARMLGGKSITAVSRKHAKEMLAATS